MEKVKILIACHKPSFVPHDNVYTPIHVGRKLVADYSSMDDMIGDDTGENISCKNRNYCELTGLYWGWKNLDVKYKGLCHYRRYFDFRNQDPKDFLGNYDIVIPKTIVLSTRASDHLMNLTTREDFYIMVMSVLKLYPDYKEAMLQNLFNTNRCSCFNMLFCQKDVYDGYCTWLFSVFDEMEKWVKLSSYTRLARLYGFLSEYLLLVYCRKNNLKIKYADVQEGVYCLNNDRTMKGMLGKSSFMQRFVKDFIFLFYPKLHKFPIFETCSVGFKTDGIPYIDENGNIIKTE